MKKIGFLCLFFLITVVFLWWYLPSFQSIKIFSKTITPVVFHGSIQQEKMRLIDNKIMVSVSFLTNQLDANIYIEGKSEKIILTTKEILLRFQGNQSEAFLNGKPFKLTAANQKIENEWYISWDDIKKIYPFEIHAIENGSRFSVIDLAHPGGLVLANTSIREDANKKQPITGKIIAKDKVEIIDRKDDWLFIQKDDGFFGWTKASNIQVLLKKDSVIKEKSSPIHIVWDQIFSGTSTLTASEKLEGINVLIPTWFSVFDEQGTIRVNGANADYVKYAHSKNIQVWGLVQNQFDPKLTHNFLLTYDKRIHIIQQLISYAKNYNLDGINVDFENVNVEDKNLVTQFIYELTALANEKKLIISVNVTAKSDSKNWSLFYDRKAIGEVVDYVILMAYDQTPEVSSKSGSVATIPWTEQSIQGLLEEVSPEKLVLGIPLYTRVWEEKSGKTSSKTLSHKYEAQWLKNKKVTPSNDPISGQHYVEYRAGENLIKLWLEDDFSIQKRIDFIRKYQFSGIASWSKMHASDDLWHTIATMMK
jgi:spore germination protein